MHKNIPARLRDRITVDTNTGCWIYKGSTPSSNGYERCWLYGTRWQTHRLIFELITGKDIRTKQLDHLCEVRQCCNPAHLDPVTPKRNCLRKFNRRKFPPEFKHTGITHEI
jgi:hypothetical protein